MATDNNKGKKPAEEAPSGKQKKKKDTNYRYDVNRCDRCKIAGKDLPVLKSEWRAVVLCKDCLLLVDSADLCSYCFKPIHQELVDSTHEVPILTCHSCFRRIHHGCLYDNQPLNVSGTPIDPVSFTCVDCNPFHTTLRLNNPSYKHSDLTKKKEEEEEEEEKASKSSPRKSRKFLKEEKNVEGSSSGGGRSSSSKTRAMKTWRNIPADRVDKIDKWEWEKFDQKEHTDQAGSPDHHPNRICYRCKNFSQGCPVEKHVEQSRNNQQTFDVTYTSHRHNHRLPGHHGSSTSKLTSLPPKSAERSAKGKSSSTSRTSSPPKSTERSAKGKSITTSKSSSPPKSAKRSAEGRSSTSKSSSPPNSAKRSAKGKSSNTSKSSSPPKSAKRSGKGSKTSSPPKSAE